MALGQRTARQQAAQRTARTDSREAVCVSVDWPAQLAVVNVGGVERVMPWAGPAPWPGDTVRVVTAGQVPVCWVTHGSPMGTVLSASSELATVAGDDGRTYAYPFRVGDALAPGDRVRLDHVGRMVLGEYTDEPPGIEYVTPAAPPAASGGSRTFYPTDSGNYYLGTSYKSQYVEVSSQRSAFYWYGRQIANSIPDGATVTIARLKLVELWDKATLAASHLGTHADPSAAHGPSAPTLSGSIDVTSGGTINILPFAAALRDGDAFGVGFALGYGWRRFDTGARSGAIYMEWS